MSLVFCTILDNKELHYLILFYPLNDLLKYFAYSDEIINFILFLKIDLPKKTYGNSQNILLLVNLVPWIVTPDHYTRVQITICTAAR